MKQKRYTKKDVQKAILQANRRLKTFTKHTPTIEYSINEDYFFKLTRKGAVEALDQLRWSNVRPRRSAKISDEALKGLTMTVHSKNRQGKIDVIIPNEYKERTLRTLKNREDITGKPFNLNLQSQKAEAIKAGLEFAGHFANKKEYKEWSDTRKDQAMRNFKNNITNSLSYSTDDLMRALATIIINMLDKGKLTYEMIKESNLNEVAGLNLFDSIEDVVIKANAQAILDELRIAIPITDEQISELLKKNGLPDEAIDELLGL